MSDVFVYTLCLRVPPGIRVPHVEDHCVRWSVTYRRRTGESFFPELVTVSNLQMFQAAVTTQTSSCAVTARFALCCENLTEHNHTDTAEL
jgi:hypothetical protein